MKENSKLVNEIRLAGEIKSPTFFALKGADTATTTRGSCYLRGQLMDSLLNEIPFKIWNFTEPNFEYNSILIKDAKLDSFQGVEQFIISSYELMLTDLVDFIDKPFNEKEIEAKIYKYSGMVQNPIYSELIKYYLLDNKTFWVLPAATNFHHAYKGGLSQHIAEVVENAYLMARGYDNIDMDLLLTGALLHDLGKLKVYNLYKGLPGYTYYGDFYEHLTMGVLMVHEYCARYNIDVEKWDIVKLDHIILSHHGKREYGSPVPPVFQEAVIVNKADNMSAEMNKLDKLANSLTEKASMGLLNNDNVKIYTNKFKESISGCDKITNTPSPEKLPQERIVDEEKVKEDYEFLKQIVRPRY